MTPYTCNGWHCDEATTAHGSDLVKRTSIEDSRGVLVSVAVNPGYSCMLSEMKRMYIRLVDEDTGGGNVVVLQWMDIKLDLMDGPS